MIKTPHTYCPFSQKPASQHANIISPLQTGQAHQDFFLLSSLSSILNISSVYESQSKAEQINLA